MSAKVLYGLVKSLRKSAINLLHPIPKLKEFRDNMIAA